MTDASERRKSRMRRWLEDWATMLGASVVIITAIVGACDALGIEFPLVTHVAYAQDQKETHRQIAQMQVDIVEVKRQLTQMSTDILKRDERDLLRDIREMEIQIAAGSNPEVRRLLNAGLDKARQDIAELKAELSRRGVQ